MSVYLHKRPRRLNSVSLTFIAVFAVLGYFAWCFVPIYWPIFQLTGIMRSTCNEAYRNSDNKALMEKLLRDARRTGLRLSKDNFLLTREMYTPEELVDENPRWRDVLSRRGKSCELKMIYVTPVDFPLIGYRTEWTFRKTVRQDLPRVIQHDQGCG